MCSSDSQMLVITSSLAITSNALRTSSGRSSRSLRLSCGMMTRLMPARWAASSFSLIPPTSSTRPFSVISPVIATSCRTARPVNRLARQVATATPADGPSFGVAPSGKWMWMSVVRKTSGEMSNSSQLARM